MPQPITLQRREFAGRHEGPHLVINGGIHGDEFEPMRAVRRLIRYLDAEVSPDDLHGRVTLIPCVNEAAFLRGHRTAGDGLDLARVCPGKADGTVTERTAWALAPFIERADLYVDLHTGGTELAVLPFVGYAMHPDPGIRRTQRRMARAFNLPNVWGTAPDKEGRTLSVARDAGVPAIYAEYLGSAGCDPAGVEAYFTGCLDLMAEFGLLRRTVAVPAAKRIVEDPRPDSGHMQVCNPSPMTGDFEAAVALGDEIESGEPLGDVTDHLGGETATIRSTQTGVVLVLRTFPRVREGETVGVIQEAGELEVPVAEWMRRIDDG